MADGKTTNQIFRDQQQAASAETAAGAQIEGRLKDLHTCMPGIIASFDPDLQTASVQPAIKRIFTEKGPVNLPLCVDVPVEFPGGGDFFMTFPVKPGDECILLFSERAIDLWFESGGTQSPAEYRLHDLSDGMALVGINSKPKKIPSFNPDDVELRDRDRTVRVTMKHDGTIENVNPVGSTVLSAAGKFTVNAPGGFEVNAPLSKLNSDQTTMSGKTTSQGLLTYAAGMAGTGGGSGTTISGPITQSGGAVTSNGIVLHTHTHSGVQSGPASTGGPQ